VFFARRGEMASNRREEQEISMLVLHLNPKLHGLYQYADDPEAVGPAALARQIHAARLRRFDTADMGTRQSVWLIRSRYEYTIGLVVNQMGSPQKTEYKAR
jgi:hypothetical protein